jgi:hypothetical protein
MTDQWSISLAGSAAQLSLSESKTLNLSDSYVLGIEKLVKSRTLRGTEIHLRGHRLTVLRPQMPVRLERQDTALFVT